MAQYTNEVLVLASAAVRLDTGFSGRSGIEIQNLGPNAIYVAIGAQADAVVTKSRKLATGESWSIAAWAGIQFWAKAATADQVTGAATIVTEVP